MLPSGRESQKSMNSKGTGETAGKAIVNALTVDVEDYFQVSAFEKVISPAAWDSYECRVEKNVARLLAQFERNDAKATFFILGWVAKRYPQLVRDIHAAGHEVASHGFDHQRASDQLQADFYQDIFSAKALLEDIAGVAVRGYRAPSFSINAGNPWAFDSIEKAGYRYSSSVYPVKHDHYGLPGAPRIAFSPRSNLIEIPITTTMAFGRALPAGGGGYFRLAPYRLSRWAIRRFNAAERKPAIFYFHPWEIDPGQPRVKGIPMRSRMRHYVNLASTESKLERLLQDFQWDRVDRAFAADLGQA